MRNCFRIAAFFALLPVLHAQTTRTVPGQYSTLSAAVTAANSGDTILVTDSSVYHEHISFGSKILTLQAQTKGGPTLNGDGAGPVVTITTGTNTTTGNSSVIGFNITNAGQPQSSGGPHGAISISAGAPTIQNNHFMANYCAAISSTNASPQVLGNTITGTLVTSCAAGEGLGSAIAIAGSAGTLPLTIQSNTITNNNSSIGYTADTGGGGAMNITGATEADIALNLLADNTSTGYGGAVYIASTPSIYFDQNVVYGNKGVSGGLDIVVPGASVGPVAGTLNNNTIGYNTATSNAAGSDVYVGGNLAQYQVVNNIVYGTTAGQTAFLCGTAYASQTLTPLVFANNDFFSINGNTPVGGACSNPTGTNANISQDPAFSSVTPATVAAGTADFSLSSASPAIDGGDNSTTPLFTVDFIGNARYWDGKQSFQMPYPIIDIGAYEYNSCVLSSKCVQDSQVTALAVTSNTYTPAAGGSLILTAQFYNPGTLPSSGMVYFFEDNIQIGSASINGSGAASFTVAGLTGGTHLFLANYFGQAPLEPATSVPVYIFVSGSGPQTFTALSASPSSPSLGASVTLTAAVTAPTTGAVPTGTVYFTDGAITLGTAPVDGTGHASLVTSFTTAGGHSLVAAFVPSGAFVGSTGTLTLVVTGIASQSTLTASPLPPAAGQPLTLTATISAAVAGSTQAVPTGTVTFSVDGALNGVAGVTNGVASLVLNGVPAGNHVLTCFYSGDATFNTSQCNTINTTVAAGAVTLTLTSSANPGYALTPVTFTVATTPATPNVSVTLASNAISSGLSTLVGTATTNAAGVAGFKTQFSTGTYDLIASTPTSANKPVLSETIQANPTSTTLLVTPNPANIGQTVTLAVSVLDTTGAQSPNGTVTVTDTGGVVVASGPTLPSSATSTLASVALTTSSLAAGTHILSASFTPADGNFLASATGAPTSLLVGIPSITLIANPAAISIQTQHHAGLTLTVASVLGFSGNVQLACATPLPAYLSCEFAQSNINVANNGNASTTLTLETDAIPGFESVAPLSFNTPQGRWLSVGALATLALLAFAGRRRRSLRVLAAAILALALTTGLSGCSGKYPGHTPPGTYTVTVNAIGTAGAGSQAPQASTNITLTVTP